MSRGLLDGCVVIDASTLFAGPFAATLLGDHGAEVIKVEHPRGDDLRHWGPRRDGVPLWWKVVSRNKRHIALDLHDEAAQDAFRRLAAGADVVISNFRPGRLDAWGIGWDRLHEINPRLILAEVSGFGQAGPYASLPGFGTLAESMSGFAAVNGEEAGGPLLPPFGLADGIAGFATAFAVSAALSSRAADGVGVRIDTALYEPLMWIVGSHIVEYDQLGIIQQRMGNSVPQTAPRNVFQTRDGRWVSLSGAAQSVTERLLTAIGRPEAITDPRFDDNQARLQNREALDALIGEWILARDRDEVIELLRAADVAIAPIYDAADIVTDAHFTQRGSIVEVDDPDLGPVRMQGVVPTVTGREGSIRSTGPAKIGTDTTDVLTAFGFSPDEVRALLASGAAFQSPEG